MSSSEEEASEIYDYTLVQFVHRGKKRKVEQVDIIPTKWLTFDKKKGKCITKFMQSFTHDEDLKLLHDLIKTQADAPEDWPYFTVELKGRAKTYKEALVKIKRLEIEENVFTQESEESSTEVKNKIVNTLKKTKLQEEADAYKLEVSLPLKDTSNIPKELQENSTVNNSENKINQPQKTDEIPASQSKTLCLLGLSNETNENLSANNTASTNLSTEKSKTNVIPNFYEQVDSFDNIPVIELQSTAFEEAVIKRLDKMEQNMQNIMERQEQISNFLIDKKVVGVVNSKDSFNIRYKLSLPLQTVQSFLEFDESLKGNQLLRNDVCLELVKYLDKNLVISKCLVKMLKRFMMGCVASQFTASRSSKIDKTKRKFKGTELCDLMFERNEKQMTTTDKDLTGSLTDVLSNANKWDK